MKTITPLHGQSLLDIALQLTGSIEAAFELAHREGISITDDVVGVKLNIDHLAVKNQGVVNYYRQNQILPATDADVRRTFDDTFDLTFN